MTNGIDYQSRFSGKHSKSIFKIAHKEYKIAAIANGIRNGMINQNKITKDATRVIYESDSFPTTGYGYNHKLNPELAKKIEEAFKTFRWHEGNNTKQKPFNKFGENHFIDADYKNKWEIIRDIDKANNITYDCR
jgi:phosphonate transport system substrate-binding protein